MPLLWPGGPPWPRASPLGLTKPTCCDHAPGTTPWGTRRELTQARAHAQQLAAELAQERAASAAALAAHAAEREALLLDRDGVVCDVDRLVVQVQELEG